MCYSVGWVQLNPTFPALEFSGKSLISPSSSKAKGLAILLALLTVSRGYSVHIYTDSLNCINNYMKISTTHRYRKVLKIKNYNIWNLINSRVKHFELHLNFHKVKVYSNIPFNDKTDELAKQNTSSDNIFMISDMSNVSSTASVTWMDKFHIYQNI